MKNSPHCIVVAALSILLAGSLRASAELKLPSIFGDHMVLQDGMPLPVWGTADPGQEVTVTFGEKSAKATAGADGKWEVKLPPIKASSQPGTMTVAAGAQTLQFSDVLVGEVWVCSGQSNMEFPLAAAHNSATELPQANDAQLRLFLVKKTEAHTPAADVTGQWQVCTPESARGFTAVGYFFAKELRTKLSEPVGLIGTYWGGTPAEAWTSLDGLKQDAMLAHYVQRWEQLDAGYAKAHADLPAATAAYKAAFAEWQAKYGKDYAAALKQWAEENKQAMLAHQAMPRRPNPPAPIPLAPDPNGGPGAPAGLYNGMVAALQPYAIRGAIWYQGEANAGRAEEYRTLFPRLIKDWREKWGEGDFPFLWVQLAAYHADDSDAWPNLRDAQLATLSLPKTGMATAVDIGLPTNIHPMDKLDVGKRLALAARHVAYGEKLVYSGPIFKSATKDGAALRVQFHDLGSGLEIGQSPWVGPGADTLPADHLVGFEIAGADGAWKPADAKIDGNAVVVSSADVPNPAEVRYDWKAYPEGNLYNKDGLPAVPFHGKAE
jgi:sialate O-acetylesterase